MPEINVMRNSQIISRDSSSPLHQASRERDGESQVAAWSKESVLGRSSTSDVVVLCWMAPRESDRRALEIAAFMGSNVRFLSLSAAVLTGSPPPRSIFPRCSCLIVEAETLAKIAQEMPAGVSALSGALELVEHVYVYGFQPTASHNAVLQALSSKGLIGARALSGDATLHVAADQAEWCFQFSGLSVGSADPARDRSFVEGDASGELATLVRVGDQPFFVRGKNGRSKIFFLAGGELADLDENVTRHCSGLKWFCGLVPLMMFLRGALKERVWHNDHPRACFIIDDPLLQRRHGFLEYKRLLNSLSRQTFSVCIAFIPWNYRRSNKKIAQLFLSNPEVAFLCVHGCDHTGAEFEARDTELLRGKAQLALDRMRKHQQHFGIPFDEVMVFPQGLFSAEALPALKAAGYLAAVNTELSPSTNSRSLSLRDLLDVAVTRFADFPVFGRHYPNELAEFAFDLFLGKPALAVEHHGYFRDGHDALENFIQRLNALDSRMQWSNLGTICSHACLTRRSESGDVYVHFYTDRFQLKNTSGQDQQYILQPSRRSGETSLRVSVDGSEWSCERENDGPRFFLSLMPGQTADIKVVSEDSQPGVPWKPTMTHRLGVWLRRVLCEVRDNYVDTSRILNRIAPGLCPVVSRWWNWDANATPSAISTSNPRPLSASPLLER